MMTPADTGSWRHRGACATTLAGNTPAERTATMAYPEIGKAGGWTRAHVARVNKARAICSMCPVLDDCRTWALTIPDPAYGMIAGGLDPKQRRDSRMGRAVAEPRRPGRPTSQRGVA